MSTRPQHRVRNGQKRCAGMCGPMHVHTDKYVYMRVWVTVCLCANLDFTTATTTFAVAQK